MIGAPDSKNREIPMKLGMCDLELAVHFSVPVLITSSSSTLRELYARRIYQRSADREGYFVVVRCGHQRSRSGEQQLDCVGAVGLQQRVGRMQATLFVDAVGRLTPEGQQELLAILESRPHMLRIICGAEPGLLQQVAGGKFDERLFYRINVIHLQTEDTPSLRTTDEPAGEVRQTGPSSTRPDH